MALSLNKFAAKDKIEVKIRNPETDEVLKDDDGKEVVTHLYSKASKVHKNAQFALQNRYLKSNKKTTSAERIEEESLELLVACSIKIDNLELDGKPIDNEDAFRELYSDLEYDWLRQQIQDGLNEQAAVFTK